MRAIAIIPPGMFLSQAPITRAPSIIARFGERATPAVINLLRQLSAMFSPGTVECGLRIAGPGRRRGPEADKGRKFGRAAHRCLIYYLRTFDTNRESNGTAPPALFRH